jgi:hypothetical protein
VTDQREARRIIVMRRICALTAIHTRAARAPRERPAGDVNPFEVYLLGACVVQGYAVLSHVAEPHSLQDLLPPWLRIMWGALLLIGGALSVGGLYWLDPFTGIEVKRVGLVCAGGGTFAYGLALVALGPTGFVAAATCIAFTIACVVRVKQVSRALNAARGRITAMRPSGGSDGVPS